MGIMENNNLQKRIDKVIDKHDRILDENNFGLWIEPCPLYPKEHIKVELRKLYTEAQNLEVV